MKLLIIGNRDFAKMAAAHFNYDSKLHMSAFTVDKEYIEEKLINDFPVIPFDNDITMYCPIKDYVMFAAITYGDLNKTRQKLYEKGKAIGYKFVSYISKYALIADNCGIGENCFIFEFNNIQYNVRMGNNNIFWSGNHIGHSTEIGNHNFICSHVCISGNCKIGDFNFFGVNSCVSDGIKIGDDCVIGAGAVVIDDCESGKVYVGNPAKAIKTSDYFRNNGTY